MPHKTAWYTVRSCSFVQKFTASDSYFFSGVVLFLHFAESALPFVVVSLLANPCHSKEISFPESDKEKQSP